MSRRRQGSAGWRKERAKISEMPDRSPAIPSPMAGIATGAVAVGIATLALRLLRPELSIATAALVLVLPGVIGGLFGGRLPAASVALVSAVVFGVEFVKPYGQFKVRVAEDGVAVTVFLFVALAVGEITAREARRRWSAEQRAAELEVLTRKLQSAEEQHRMLAGEVDRLAVMQQVDEQRAALLRSVSHDLRTPLATIRAVTSDLRSDTPYDQPTRDELLELVSDEAERLDRLVANLLNLSRIEASGLVPDLQAVDLPELVATTVDRLSRLLRGKRVQVDIPVSLSLVDVDYTQIDQVLTNLLENAVRHTLPRSTVRIGAREHGCEQVEIWVQDEGVGIPRSERARIFEAFRQGRGSGSTGIGLAICKAVVEAHGGTIVVGDAPGGGARFSFTVPVRHG
jgi:K+-sensing histidine kinase KdpD